MTDWDRRFLDLAAVVAGWSKDPNTRVGAVIVRPDRTVVSLGYNGFPRGIADDARLADREVKLRLVVHAEMNALLAAGAAGAGGAIRGCTLYTWPLAPCERCAAHIIQAGIARVVAPAVRPDHAGGIALLREAGIAVDVVGARGRPDG